MLMAPTLTAAAVTYQHPSSRLPTLAELADDARSRARTNLRGAGSGCSDKEIAHANGGSLCVRILKPLARTYTPPVRSVRWSPRSGHGSAGLYWHRPPYVRGVRTYLAHMYVCIP